MSVVTFILSGWYKQCNSTYDIQLTDTEISCEWGIKLNLWLDCVGTLYSYITVLSFMESNWHYMDVLANSWKFPYNKELHIYYARVSIL